MTQPRHSGMELAPFLAVTSADNTQIIKLARDGLSPEEIAESLGYDPTAVTMVLQDFPETAKNVEDKLEKAEDLAISVMTELMLDSKVDAVRQRAAAYILDTRMGLKRHQSSGAKININVLNVLFEKARRRRQELDI